jgi:hypothetical protein
VTDADLKAIQARADAATPGPWYYIHDDDAMFMNCYAVATDADADPSDPGHEAQFVAGCLVQSEVRIVPPALWHENTTFIAHARSDVPALLAEVRLLRGIIADQQQESGLFDAGFRAGRESTLETAGRAGFNAGVEAAAALVDEWGKLGQVARHVRSLRQHASTE